ncbi:hypothetical protein D3C75_1260710 [compost metagenome]
MVSSVRYPNFKKHGLPKKALVYAPFVVALAIFIGVMFPVHLSKMIFIPLVIYALYGLKQNIVKLMRRNKKQYEDSEERFSSRH